ncbi:MAG: hypothetical protein ABTQ32_25165 [Myxococcaceae bacterium]
MRALLLGSVFCLSLTGCRMHTLQDGAYDFALTEVLRDDCALSMNPAVFTRGTLATAGHVVHLDYQYLAMQLVGTYRYGLEEMTMDATLGNVRTTLRGQECQVDSVAVALDSTTVNAGRFNGTMSFTFNSRSSDACTCRLYFRYAATRAP